MTADPLPTPVAPASHAPLSRSTTCRSPRPPALPVVIGVSFEIVPGEVLGVVGESGSGKTTVGLALLGHARRGLKITGGSILLGDQEHPRHGR